MRPNLVALSASESASDMHGTEVVFVFVPALDQSTGGSDVADGSRRTTTGKHIYDRERTSRTVP